MAYWELSVKFLLLIYAGRYMYSAAGRAAEWGGGGGGSQENMEIYAASIDSRVFYGVFYRGGVRAGTSPEPCSRPLPDPQEQIAFLCQIATLNMLECWYPENVSENWQSVHNVNSWMAVILEKVMCVLQVKLNHVCNLYFVIIILSPKDLPLRGC